MTKFADTLMAVTDNSRTRQIARDEYAAATSQAKFAALRKTAEANAKSFSAKRTFALA